MFILFPVSPRPTQTTGEGRYGEKSEVFTGVWEKGWGTGLLTCLAVSPSVFRTVLKFGSRGTRSQRRGPGGTGETSTFHYCLYIVTKRTTTNIRGGHGRGLLSEQVYLVVPRPYGVDNRGPVVVGRHRDPDPTD